MWDPNSSVSRSDPLRSIARTTFRVWEGLDVRTVGVSFDSVRVERLGEWVMGQLDARLGRGSSSIGVLNKIPSVPPSGWDGTFNRRESDRLSSSRLAPAGFKG